MPIGKVSKNQRIKVSNVLKESKNQRIKILRLSKNQRIKKIILSKIQKFDTINPIIPDTKSQSIKKQKNPMKK